MAKDQICEICNKIVPRKEDWEDLYLILSLKESKTPQWTKTISNNFFLKNFCFKSEHEKSEEEHP